MCQYKILVQLSNGHKLVRLELQGFVRNNNRIETHRVVASRPNAIDFDTCKANSLLNFERSRK